MAEETYRHCWFPAAERPEGINHGATAICFTDTGEVVLVEQEPDFWVLPGGRPEPGETIEETMRREVLEEACAEVRSAQVIGWVQGSQFSGTEQSKVRSIWRAEVTLLPWNPEHETLARKTVPLSDLPATLASHWQAQILHEMLALIELK